MSLDVGENTEVTAQVFAIEDNDLGISVSVDGDPTTANAPTTEDLQRAADVDLNSIDVQIKFDGLEVEPVLNISTVDTRRSFQAGEQVEFLATSNYPAWIERAEVRIYKEGKSGLELLETADVSINDTASWIVPDDSDDEYKYVLRVYDNKNRFDETAPLSIKRTAKLFETHETSQDGDLVSAGEGQDRTAVRNIPVYGGAVTVFGRDVPNGYEIDVLGETVSTDGNNKFVVQRILPPGNHSVEVAISNGYKDGVEFSRDINIPSNEWFYVGLVDATVGLRTEEASGEFEEVYTKGRLAFYLKGKIKGRYLLTAAADTSEQELENLFRGLDAKNPRELLRRIDPNKYYPVYGDDSTAKEDAPTSGKFYVRLERGDSHVMWGNFKSNVDSGSYLRNERTLYGANAVYKSEAATEFGERKVEIELYAAQPGTLPQRDVLRGTGGSAYFLSRQDISVGSESVFVEVRDPVSGRVLERIKLTYAEDYTIDYMQGVIILKQPLSGFAGSGLIRDDALGENEVSLISQYEYTPVAGQVDGYSFGGRAQAWLGEKVRIGATGMHEETGNGTIDADQQMIGADIVVRHSDTTFFEAEYAQTEGPGFGRTLSTDGGLSLVDEASASASNRVAQAWRIAGQLDFADFNDRGVKGKLGGYYEQKEAGFSTLDFNVTSDQVAWGVYSDIELSDRLTAGFQFDDFYDDTGKKKRELEAEAAIQLDQYWEASFGIKYSELTTPGGLAKENGTRADIGAQLTYSPNDDHSYYIFGQGTVARSGGRLRNDRGGVGAQLQLTEKIGLNGEVSYGTGGIGALAALTYDPTADEHYYLGYELDPDRIVSGTSLVGSDSGSILLGAKRKYDDFWSAYTENNYDMFGERRSLTSTYGVTFTPDAKWTLDGGLEIGVVRDPNATDIDRKAVSFGVAYKESDDFLARLRAELRFDGSEDDTRDLNAYLVSAGATYKVNPDWRLTANIDAVLSDTDQASVPDGDYIESALGFAYRPVENDRLNALFKYAFLYDLPGSNQTTADGSTLGPRQRSHVLSADATYDINEIISLGAKYGFRIGEVETTRGSGEYIQSDAHLGVIRADVHILHNWDALVEGRVLRSVSTQTTQFGALAAIYRHLGKNVKAGVGYNFGRFSDDLTDLVQDDQGLFFNVVGKF